MKNKYTDVLDYILKNCNGGKLELPHCYRTAAVELENRIIVIGKSVFRLSTVIHCTFEENGSFSVEIKDMDRLRQVRNFIEKTN